jgi:hypothetical protein
MTRASVTILDIGGGDDGHRAQYIAFLGDLFAIRRVRLNWRVLIDPNPVLVPLIEESLGVYALVGLMRSLIGKRTAGFLFRPGPAISNRSARHRIKYWVLRLLRLVPRIQTLTILPFAVEPRFAEIADGWIYDPQIWDLHWPKAMSVAPSGGALSNTIRQLAGDRTICVAVGRQDISKGFDQFTSFYAASEPLRDASLFAYGGKVAQPCEDAAAEFAAMGGYAINRFIDDAELLELYGCADLVWCAYAPDYDQASGILGRAMQLGIPVVVRNGSLIQRLCRIEALPHVAVDRSTAWQSIAAPPRRQAPDVAATRALRHGEVSIARLCAALGLSGLQLD